jgi:integrase
MKEFYISSTKCSIRERQTKKHGKVYDVLFRIITFDGVEKLKKLSGYANKTLAKQGYVNFITEKCELVKNNPIKRQKRIEKGQEVLTIKDLSKTYFLAIRNQVKDSSIYDAQNIFKLFIYPKFENYQLKDITKQELIKWQDELWSTKNPRKNDYYSYKYLSKIRTFFSAFLTWIEERNEGFVNFLLSIKKPKRRISKTEMQFWTREEFEKFIGVVDNQMYRTLFSMLFFTGRRKGEVLALSPADVKDKEIVFNKSLTRKTLDNTTYKVTSTKAEKSATSLICKPLKKELSYYTVPKGQFYFGGNTPIAENTLTRAFNRYCELAGVKQIRLHDLRHSFVSMVVSLGGSIPLVADLISDTIEMVTKTYLHLYSDDKRNIINKIC